MRRLASLSLLLALSARAQEKLVESIEVHVVNVDVVVTDRAGNRVPGLTKNDFELFENGKPQSITNFYEVRPDEVDAPHMTSLTPAGPVASDTPSPEARARHIVVFIDDYSVEPRTRAQLLASLHKFVAQELREGVEAT